MGIEVVRGRLSYLYKVDGKLIAEFFVNGSRGEFLDYDPETFQHVSDFEAWLADMLKREFKPALSVIMQAGLLPKPLRERLYLPYKIEFPLHHGDIDCE